MKKLTFDEIRKRGLLLYEYVRGSKLYHTDTPDSDEDIGGVFIAPIDFDFKYQEEVSDDKNDSKWWELGKFMEMAMTSNPAVLEAFFVPLPSLVSNLSVHMPCSKSKRHKVKTRKSIGM